MKYVTLSNGVQMPQLGYGVYQVTKDECQRCVADALKVGYRLIDTAQSYFNEEEVGQAIAASGIPRQDIFLTTKVWIEHYGYDSTRASVLDSMRKLQVDYLDLCLLHQPFGDVYGAYRALEDLYREGKLRAIGISNFYPDRMIDLASFCRIRPMVNQVEIHPPFISKTKAKPGTTSMVCSWRPGRPLAKAGVICSICRCSRPLRISMAKPWLRSFSAGICKGALWSFPSPPTQSAWRKTSTCSISP